VFTYQNLLDTVLMVQPLSNMFDLFTFVKVKQIEIWCAPILGAAVSVTAVFNGITAGSQGDDRVVTDTSMAIEPAHIVIRPDEKTLASEFQPSSSATCFSLQVPIGSVVDVVFSFKGLATTPVAAQNPGSASTGGTWAFRGLDGVALATSKFTIAGLANAQV